MPTQYETAFAQATAYFNGQPVARLRKLAAGKVKNVSRLPKAALVAELAKLEVQRTDSANVESIMDQLVGIDAPTEAELDLAAKKDDEERAAREAADDALAAAEAEQREAAREHDAKAKALEIDNAKAAHRTKKAKVKAAYDAILGRDGNFRVHKAGCRDFKNERRNSDGSPFHYGSEATPESIAADLYTDFIPDEMTSEEALELVEFLPCCGFESQTKLQLDKAGQKATEKPAKASKAAKPTKALPPKVSKAQRFADFATEHGWKPKMEMNAAGREIVTAHNVAGSGEWVRIEWDNGVFNYQETSHKGRDGKMRKVRNASAAKVIIEMAE